MSIYLFAPWQYALHYLTPLPATVQEQVDQVTDYGLDGAIVYVDRAGQDPAFHTSGWHDRDKKIPAYPEAYFKIASIGKLYDAVAVSKLVASGTLSLDKTLTDYLPQLRDGIDNADQITLKMMVQHRSGIPNYVNQEGWDWGNISPDANSSTPSLFLSPVIT